MLENYLKQKSLLIIDGALGTELEKRECDLSDPLWSAKLLLENPKVIQAVHEDYLRSGADVIITSTYQATYEGFMKQGLSEEEAKHLITLAIELAKETRDGFTCKDPLKPLVAASIGPYGAYLADGSEFTGNYGLSLEALKEFHAKRLKTIIEATPDLLACETLPCLLEAKALVELLEAYPHMSAWISFSAKDALHTSEGDTLRECALYLNDKPQIKAIGINCTAPEFVSSLIKEIKAVSDKPIIVYPNKGGDYDALSKTWKADANLSSFESYALDWFDAGARLIGGCCQSGPEDIKAISKRLKERLLF